MKELYSTKEVAEILGITPTAVLQKIYSGQLKAKKVGRNYIIANPDLPNVLATHISDRAKKEIQSAVSRTVKEYGETLKRLGKE